MAHKHILLQLNDGINDKTSAVVAEVKILQTVLKDWGELDASEIDGQFGDNTNQAVKDFQGKKSLKVDGIVGQNTWAALLKVSPSEVEIIPRPSDGGSGGDGHYDLSKIPSEWKHAATSLVPILVKAFHDQGINDLRVLAYACATIGRESSWNPTSENKTDRYAGTPWSGKGLAQITTPDNYENAKKDTGIDFVNHPEYMFDPEKSLRAKAAYYKRRGMIPYIEKGNDEGYQHAAGLYNGAFHTSYTRNVAHDTLLWLPVFQ